jgi:hypothetical protein
MPKAKTITVVSKCQCSACGQIASVVIGTQHFHCRGIRLLKPLPAMFSGLINPRKGTWELYVAPVVEPALHIAMSEPAPLLAT